MTPRRPSFVDDAAEAAGYDGAKSACAGSGPPALARTRVARWPTCRATACVAALLLTACARDPRRAVIGEWERAGERIEFLQGGRLLYKHPDGTVALANYGFPEKRVLRVRALAATPADYRVRVKRDSLVMCGTAAGAECFRFARVKQGE